MAYVAGGAAAGKAAKTGTTGAKAGTSIKSKNGVKSSKNEIVKYQNTENVGVGNSVEIVGKGSTGRTEAKNLTEQMAMHEVKSNPMKNAIDLSQTKKVL